MDLDILRKKTSTELSARLNDKLKDYDEIKYNLKLGRETKYGHLKYLRKEIARIQTIINEGSYKK